VLKISRSTVRGAPQQIQHPPIQKAWQRLRALSGDERTRREAFVRERALRDAITERSVALAEGKAEGITIGQAAILNRLLRMKFGKLPPAIEQQLQHATQEQLACWTDQILFADTLEQVFNHH